MNIRNPYVEKECTVTNFSDITQRTIEACKQQSPANGLCHLRIYLKKIGEMADPNEFRFGMKAFGVEISEDEMTALLKCFDYGRTGKLCIADMLYAMRSNSFTGVRENLVCKAYAHLKKQGPVTIGLLEKNYDVKCNPQFQRGEKSQAQLTQEFLACLGSSSLDTPVSCEQFCEYYRDVSPTIIEDKTWANMINNTWGM